VIFGDELPLLGGVFILLRWPVRRVQSRRGQPVWIRSSTVPDQLPALATPAEVAQYLHTTTAALAQDRYNGSGPKFIKRGGRVLYR
jgi:hypothetical protein